MFVLTLLLVTFTDYFPDIIILRCLVDMMYIFVLIL